MCGILKLHGVFTHLTSFGSVKLLLASVLQHAVHHAAALPHIKQRLAVLEAQLLQPEGGWRGGTTVRWWWWWWRHAVVAHIPLNVLDIAGRGTHSDLVELGEVQGAVVVDGGPDVLAVLGALHQLQLPHAAHVGQPRLDLRHVEHLPCRI